MTIPAELKNVTRVLTPTQGLPADNNHDPSNILFVDGKYYLWYTQHRNDRPFSGFYDALVRCCTSPDGYNWDTHFDALLPGAPGTWDAGGVLTANVVPHEGRYYMFYTGVGEKYATGEDKSRRVGIAVAAHPDGPFERVFDGPRLVPEADGTWDDFGCDDVSAVFFKGRWHIYFKGESLRVPNGNDTVLGLAYADRIEGPYTRYADNPVIRGHAFAIWPYKQGLLLLTGTKDKEGEGSVYNDQPDWADPAGVQYLYYSEDGIHFEPCAPFDNRAPGVYCPGNDLSVCWGVTVSTRNGGRGRYIERFDFAVTP